MEQYNQQTIQTILEQTKYTVTSRGFMFKHQDVTYYVDRTNLSKKEDIKLMEDILYSKQALIDASAEKYQTQFGELPDQDAALKISIFINENNKEVKHIFYEYNGNQGDDSFLNPNLINRSDREEKTEILAEEASIEDSGLFDIVDGIGNSAFSKIESAIGATIDYADSTLLETGSAIDAHNAFDSVPVAIEPNPLVNPDLVLGSAEEEETTSHMEDEGNDNKENSAVDGSVVSEEPAAYAAEHNAPEQHQNMEAKGGDNTDAPSFFSTFFSTIGDFFSSVFSSIFSFIFGPDSEEKEEDQQPPQVSELVNSNSAEEEEGGAPNPESDALESEVIEEQVIEEGQQQGQNADVVDDSTFSISSIFSTIGSYLGLSKIGSYLGLSKMGSYFSSIFSSDEEEEDSQQLHSEENLPPYSSPLDMPAEDFDVPTSTDSSGM